MELKGIYKNNDKSYTKIDEPPNDPDEVEDTEEISLDVTGQALEYPNPFSKRLEDREQHYFIKKIKKILYLKDYSRMCNGILKDNLLY